MNRYETPLSVNQRIELLERVIELIEYDLDNERDSDLDDIINDVTDNFVSPWYTEQVTQWTEMGTPEPYDWHIDQQNDNPIHTLITYAIIETAREYLYGTLNNIQQPQDQTLTTLRDEHAYLCKARGYGQLAQAIIK